jgi:hypothetical protein
MKITAITPYLVRASERESGPADRPRGRNWLFVQVQTDAGISGVGEGGGWPELVEVGVREVAPLLIGDDPRSPERVWLKIYDALHGHGLTGAVRGGVLSAIDTALWDIKGKALGVPVHELLGGAMRDRIRVYGHASTVEQAQVLLEAGYTAFKCSPSVKVIAELRRAVGDDVEIGLHGHGEFSVHAAVRLAQAAEQYRPAFFEEPTSPDRPDEMAAVAQKVSVPLAAGERLFHKWSAYQRVDRPLSAGDHPARRRDRAEEGQRHRRRGRCVARASRRVGRPDRGDGQHPRDGHHRQLPLSRAQAPRRALAPYGRAGRGRSHGRPHSAADGARPRRRARPRRGRPLSGRTGHRPLHLPHPHPGADQPLEQLTRRLSLSEERAEERAEWAQPGVTKGAMARAAARMWRVEL